jgi:hypothetical protein
VACWRVTVCHGFRGFGSREWAKDGPSY